MAKGRCLALPGPPLVTEDLLHAVHAVGAQHERGPDVACRWVFEAEHQEAAWGGAAGPSWKRLRQNKPGLFVCWDFQFWLSCKQSTCPFWSHNYIKRKLNPSKPSLGIWVLVALYPLCLARGRTCWASGPQGSARQGHCWTRDSRATLPPPPGPSSGCTCLLDFPGMGSALELSQGGTFPGCL